MNIEQTTTLQASQDKINETETLTNDDIDDVYRALDEMNENDWWGDYEY